MLDGTPTKGKKNEERNKNDKEKKRNRYEKSRPTQKSSRLQDKLVFPTHHF